MLQFITNNGNVFEYLVLIMAIGIGVVVVVKRGQLKHIRGFKALLLSFAAFVISMFSSVLEGLGIFSFLSDYLNLAEHFFSMLSVLFLLGWCFWSIRQEETVL